MDKSVQFLVLSTHRLVLVANWMDR